MGRGLSRLQAQILGVAAVTRDVLRGRGEADDRAHYANRLGVWAIYHHPAGGLRGSLNTAPVRAARAALSRAVARLERRGLLARSRRRAWALTPRGEEIGRREAAAFRGLVDLRALCGLELLRDPAGVARAAWGATLPELRDELTGRVRDDPTRS
jgi:hypothetical protein